MDDGICMPVIVVHACLYPGEYSGQGRAAARAPGAGVGAVPVRTGVRTGPVARGRGRFHRITTNNNKRGPHF